jgi:hypothetical protein
MRRCGICRLFSFLFNAVIVQVFTYLPVLTEGKQLLKAEALCLLGTPVLQGFHTACCHDGVPLTTLGPMSKVWESGVVHVVQAAENLAADAHPLNRLSEGGLVNAVAEIIYLPVYDASPVNPAQGVVASLELMIKPRTADVMIVASVITAIGEAMDSLGLALSSTIYRNEKSQHSMNVKRIERASAPPGDGMRMDMSFDVNNGAYMAMGASPRTSSCGGLSRTSSVHTLAVSHRSGM